MSFKGMIWGDDFRKLMLLGGALPARMAGKETWDAAGWPAFS